MGELSNSPTLVPRWQGVVGVLGCFLAMLAVGMIYAWSLFVPGLARELLFSNQQAQWIFGAVIAVYSITMVTAAPLLKRWHPAQIMGLAAAFFTGGFFLASQYGMSFPMVFICVGGLSGIGTGLAYTTAMSTAIALMPHRKGLISGVVVSGFALSSMLLSATIGPLLDKGLTVNNGFAGVALVHGGVLLLSVLLLALIQNPLSQNHLSKGEPTQALAQDALPLSRVAQHPFFWALFWGMATGTFSGFIVIGNLKPMLMDLGISAATALMAIPVFAVGNALGRVLWGALADRFSFRVIPPLCASFGLVGFLLLRVVSLVPELAVIFLTAVLGLCYGGHFSVYASQVAERYGVNAVPRLYPVLLLAQAVAALSGPILSGALVDKSGSFIPSLELAITLTAAGFLGTFALLNLSHKAEPVSKLVRP